MKTKLSCLILLLLLNVCLASSSYASGNYELVIIRSEHRLLVKKDNKTLHSYHVALGSGGKYGKVHQGDRKTPTGKYHISEVRTSGHFFMFMQLDYPNMNDAARALKTGLITRKVYRNILGAHLYGELPPQHTALGGSIGIHGIGDETKKRLKIHQSIDWTKGCIALRNEEIEQLRRYVHVGTLVTITN